MKAYLLLLVLAAIISSSSAIAQNDDEKRIIILEALDNEKTRNLIEVPIEGQVQNQCLLLKTIEDIGLVTIEIMSPQGETISIFNQIEIIGQFSIDISSYTLSENYQILIYSQVGTFVGVFSL